MLLVLRDGIKGVGYHPPFPQLTQFSCTTQGSTHYTFSTAPIYSPDRMLFCSPVGLKLTNLLPQFSGLHLCMILLKTYFLVFLCVYVDVPERCNYRCLQDIAAGIQNLVPMIEHLLSSLTHNDLRLILCLYFAFVCMCMQHACLVPTEVKRRHWVLWN